VTLFEYLAIAYSLVFSSAAIRLVSGLPHAVHSGRRYYVHLLHVFLLLFALVLVFWSFWSFHDLQWNLFRFLSLLTGPGLLYFLACTLVPDSPSSVTSWRDHFFSIRRTYFLGLCLWFVPLSINTTMLLDLPLLHPARAVHLGILSMGVIGATTSSPVVHTIMAIGGMVVVLFAAAVLFLPGSLAG
jgi:hypothetical protein